MPQIMQTGATPRSSRSPTPLQTTDQTTGVITEQKLLIVSNNSVGNSSVSAASSEVIDKDHLLSPPLAFLGELCRTFKMTFSLIHSS